MTTRMALFGSLLLAIFLTNCRPHHQYNPIPPPVSEAGCFSKEYERINDSDWLEEDEAQLQESKRQCWLRYKKCIKIFRKIAEKRWTVLCGE